MGTDHETEAKLLASAKLEFLEKGYAKASLRKICANAGMTTGALYFFFKDKEDLFRSIVEKPFRELLEMMKIHGDHEELVQLLIHHLYKNREAFLLLLTKSQGTAFESCIDDVVEIMEQGYRAMAGNMAAKMTGKQIDPYMLHWMIHMNIDSFVHLLTHETNEQSAMQHMQRIMDYLVKGWMELILTPVPDEK